MRESFLSTALALLILLAGAIPAPRVDSDWAFR